jgi:hypothetical protein
MFDVNLQIAGKVGRVLNGADAPLAFLEIATRSDGFDSAVTDSNSRENRGDPLSLAART